LSKKGGDGFAVDRVTPPPRPTVLDYRLRGLFLSRSANAKLLNKLRATARTRTKSVEMPEKPAFTHRCAMFAL
jgi:hypothetical protein